MDTADDALDDPALSGFEVTKEKTSALAFDVDELTCFHTAASGEWWIFCQARKRSNGEICPRMTRMYDKTIVARIWRMGRICSAAVIEKCKRSIENGGGVIWDMVSPLPRLDYSHFSGVYPLYILIKLAITC